MTIPPIGEGRHPGVQDICRWFDFSHLTGVELRAVARTIEGTAETILNLIPDDSAELTAGLRKLLEAKGCFVRAAIAASQDADQLTTDPDVLYDRAAEVDRQSALWAGIVAEKLLDTALYGPEYATKTARTQWQPLRTEADALYRRAREARDAKRADR